MTNWLFYSLLCAFSLATADAVTKWRFSEYPSGALLLIRFTLPGFMLSPFLLFRPVPHLPPEFWGWVAGAVPLEIFAMVLYMRAICLSPLCRTLPYLAFTPFFSALGAYLLLGEKITPSGFAGISLVVSGAFLLNVRHLGRGLLAPFRVVLEEEGSRLMLLVSILYGITSVLGKGALQYCPPLTFGAIYFLLLGFLAMPLAFLSRPKIQVRQKPFWAAFVGATVAVMAVSHFIAVQEINVAYMIAVKRTSLLFGMVYGALLFGEKGLGLHLLAGCLMVCGAAWISLMV